MFRTLFFTISILLGQAVQDIFLINPDQLKGSVADKESRRELKDLGKAYERATKYLNLLTESQGENFADKLLNKETRTNELRKVVNDYRFERMTTLSNLLDLRIQIQSIPEADEWNEYLESIYNEPKLPKESEIRGELRKIKRVKELDSALNEIFSVSKYESQATDSFQSFIQSLTEIAQNEADRQLANGQILSNQNASRTQLQKTLEDRFLFQKSISEAIIQFRERIFKIAEPQDWDRIGPLLSKLAYDK